MNVHVYIHWDDGIGNSFKDQLVVLALNYGEDPVILKPETIFDGNPSYGRSGTPPDRRMDYVVTSDDLQSRNIWINGKRAMFPATGIPSGLNYAEQAATPNTTITLPGHSYAFYQFLHFEKK